MPSIERSRKLSAVLAAAWLLAAGCARHDDTPAPDAAATADGFVFSEVWARATPPVATVGAVYLVIANDGSDADTLIHASTPVAERVEIHATSLEGDTMRMRPLQALDVPARSVTRLQPGGIHLMLLDLAAPLAADSHFPLTLTFEQAGAVTIDVNVQAEAGAASAAEHHAHH